MHKPLNYGSVFDMRLGIYEKAMPAELGWRERLTAAKNAGFDAVEMSIDETDTRLSRLMWSAAERNELRRVIEETGVPVHSICLSGNRRFPIGSGVPETEARGVEIIRGAVSLAYDLGIRIIQLAGYDVYYDETSTSTTRERFLENLRIVTAYAAEYGVLLGIETMENDFLNTVEKGMYYVEKVNSPYLLMYPDVGNLYNGTPDVGKDLRRGAGHIAAAHLKETVPGVFRDRCFGDGQVDFGSVIRVLKELGVTYCTAEFWYHDGMDWQSEIKRSAEFLRKYF